jgi:hypothetical protein
MVTCAIFFQRSSFCVHVWGVTLFLLVVLHKINLCYGKIRNKFEVYEQIVVLAGVMHCFVPIVGTFFPVAMYVHVGICFSVHVLHLGQCYQVFNDIHMKDTSYLVILWAVNIMEFVVNLAYCFPTVISNRMFVVPLVVVEISASLLSSLKLKSINQPKSHHHHYASTPQIDPSVPTEQQQQQPPTISLWEQIQHVITSRIVVCFLCASVSALLLAFNSYRFGIFMTGYSLLLTLNLLHFHHHTVTYHPQAFRMIAPVTPSLLIPIAWLGVFRIIPQFVTAILLIVCSLPLITLNILKLHCIMGYHYSFFVSLFGICIYLVALILYGASFSRIRILKAFMVCSIIYAMAMILTDLKLVKGRVHVNNLSESKHSDNPLSNNLSSDLNAATSMLATKL